MDPVIWTAIGICLTQSGMLSGLNLAYFSVSKLRLEVEVKKGNPHARRIHALREDANLLLSTILWGNVAVNVLLSLLSNSVMAGITAFFFSTFVITFVGEILPQAYFSRNAMRMGALLAPVIRIYQVILFPLAKPSALLLDRWLGKESIQYFREQDVREMIKLHADSSESDIDYVEGRGAVNFLAFDDLPVSQEGEPVHPDSIISIEFDSGRPVFPKITENPADEFLIQVQKSGLKWVILTDSEEHPRLALNADKLLRSALFGPDPVRPLSCCHRPIVIRDSRSLLGPAISRLKVRPEHPEDDVIDEDIIIVWGEERRIITGSDVLGRLLRGITQRIALP